MNSSRSRWPANMLPKSRSASVSGRVTKKVMISRKKMNGTIQPGSPPVQFPSMSRIGFPIALTVIVYVVYHSIGFRRVGLRAYFKNLVPGGLPGWIVPLICFLEIITFFVTRPLTLALPLFGNMCAGHLLLRLSIAVGVYLKLHGSFGLKIAGAGLFAMA